MESCDVAFRLTLEDWRAYQKECARRVRETGTRRWTILLVLAVALLVAVTAAVFVAVGVPLEPLSVAAGLLFALLPVWLYLRIWAAACAPEEDSLFFEDFRYQFDAEGIRMSRPGVAAFTHWSAVRSVSGTPEYLYLWIDRMQAHIIPTRALPTGISQPDLLAVVERWRGERVAEETLPHAVLGEAAPSASSASAPPEPERSSWAIALPRLLVLRHAPGMKDAPGWLLWLLAGLVLLAWVGLDWLRTGPGAVLSPWGASGIAWYVLMLLGVAAALSSQSKPRVSLRITLMSLLALALVLVALAAVVILVSAPKTAVMLVALAVGVYCFLVQARLLRSMTGRHQPRALANAALVLIGAWLLTQLTYVDPALWFDPDPDPYADYSAYWDQAESLLFEQPARIDAAIDKIAPPDGDSPAAFFVGFAGYGEERVFAEEIKLAARVLGERYDSSDRSVLLLNDRRDLASEPLATVASLRYALRELAAKMDVNEDLLFLSLSSHGSEDYLQVANGPLMLQMLTEEELADALRESGIKWRVIVISACHSGSFIDGLRDPDTIILTAAAADRTSFGCSNSRDLTWFGEAFYRDALPGSSSLREAFETARDSIAERERREDIDASNPQAYFGEAIERKLALVEGS